MLASGTKKTVSVYKKILYGAGGLFSAVECAFLLLFLPYFYGLNIGVGAMIAAGVTGLVLPVLLMPLLYALINGSMIITLGRYHLPLVVSSLVSTLAFVLLFSLNNLHPAATAAAVFVLLFLFSLATQVYLYVYFSIGVRLSDNGGALHMQKWFLCGGVLVFGLIYLFAYDGSMQSISNTAYLLATLALVGALCVYLGSASSIPYFIRVEPTTKRSFLGKYRRMLILAAYPPSLRYLLGSLLIFAAFTLTLFSTPMLSLAMGADSLDFLFRLSVLVIAVAAVVTYPLYRLVLRRAAAETAGRFGVLGVVLTGCAFAVCLVFAFVPVPDYLRRIFLFVVAALLGCGLSCFSAAESVIRGHFCKKSGCPYGNGYCLRNVFSALSVAMGLTVALASTPIADRWGARASVAVWAGVALSLFAAGAALWMTAFFGSRRARKKQSDGSSAQTSADEGDCKEERHV